MEPDTALPITTASASQSELFAGAVPRYLRRIAIRDWRLIPIGRGAMADGPYIRRDRRQLVGRKLRATHRRHWAAIFFWLRHAFGDCFLDSGIAAIAPQPFLAT